MTYPSIIKRFSLSKVQIQTTSIYWSLNKKANRPANKNLRYVFYVISTSKLVSNYKNKLQNDVVD